ncbi:MAG: N-acetylmuramoyl-L-alanine amidase, partial [Candidatus Omnitrophica bacterium]|nr:N-acetylmuramoyl-L-alanine amidase [Candidatus Omnitrophota bacterium]
MQKYLRIFLFCAFAAGLLSGCVTVPVEKDIATYSIGGVTYYPLISLCDLYKVDLQFDTFLRTVVLNKNTKQVSLRIGDGLVLVNDNPKQLSAPVDIYQGAIVVPRQFKEQVFDPLFKPLVSVYRRPTVAKIKLRKVVIDAGHGGNDPGAIGRGGLREKDVNLDVAKRLSVLLQEAGVQTVLSRPSDRFVPLSIRVDLANKSGADLFISIHSNANPSRSLSGFEVYYVATSVSDSQRA